MYAQLIALNFGFILLWTTTGWLIADITGAVVGLTVYAVQLIWSNK